MSTATATGMGMSSKKLDDEGVGRFLDIGIHRDDPGGRVCITNLRQWENFFLRALSCQVGAAGERLRASPTGGIVVGEISFDPTTFGAVADLGDLFWGEFCFVAAFVAAGHDAAEGLDFGDDGGEIELADLGLDLIGVFIGDGCFSLTSGFPLNHRTLILRV